jgi:hypothetical protein
VPEGGGFTVHCITIDASTPFTLTSCRFGKPLTVASDAVTH